MDRLIQKLLLHVGVLLLLRKALHAILAQELEEQELRLLLPRRILRGLGGAWSAARSALVENLSRPEVLVLLCTGLRVHVQVLMRVVWALHSAGASAVLG